MKGKTMAQDTSNALVSGLAQQCSSKYKLRIVSLWGALSVSFVEGIKKLNQPGGYEIVVTGNDKNINVKTVLSQSTSSFFLMQSISQIWTQISLLDRTFYVAGIIWYQC